MYPRRLMPVSIRIQLRLNGASRCGYRLAFFAPNAAVNRVTRAEAQAPTLLIVKRHLALICTALGWCFPRRWQRIG
jgi:hypothetical protein